MKTIKELKTDLEQIQEKGYILDSYTLTEHDIKSIIENNIKRHRDKVFYAENTENLKKDTPENFNIFNSKNQLKDFAEIENEIKQYFNKRTDEEVLNELLNEVYLLFDLNGVRSWELNNKPFEEIKNTLEREHKKELVFSNYFGSYSQGRDTADKIKKIQQAFNLILKEDFLNLDLDKIEYSEDLKSIENKINAEQDKIKIRIFGNNKIKIKFKDEAKFNKVRIKFLINEFNRYRKEVYFLSDTLRDSELKELKHFTLSENKENSFISIEMNDKTLYKFRCKYPKATFIIGNEEAEKNDIKYIYSFGLGDTWRIDTLKAHVDESRLNEYAKQRAKDLIKRFFL